jgi:MoaA/NifB/PqqE/SkfB family radical SAM enzyme
MSTPKSFFVSLTVTNRCNLRCQMCAQWSKNGYLLTEPSKHRATMSLNDWMRVIDEVAAHGIKHVLIRGGEPFMLPGIMDLLAHAAHAGIFTAIDTNGTHLAKFADDIVRIGRIHLTVSVDGPEPIHDAVRGVQGSFRQLADGLSAVSAAERARGVPISKSITFTISPWSYCGLGVMPDVARDLGVQTLCIVPYYYVPETLGRAYETELCDDLDTTAFSWRGFHHETSGIDFDEFQAQLVAYHANLGSLTNYPYLPLTVDEYRTWFESPDAPIGSSQCPNAERLIDVQPTGEANCCVDFPDYSFGNVQDATLEELFNGSRAVRFRERRRRGPLSACHRCGAKYMALIRE